MFSHKLHNIPPSTAFLFAISFFTIFFLISNYYKYLFSDYVNTSHIGSRSNRVTLITATTTTTTASISEYRVEQVLQDVSTANQDLPTADWIKTQPVHNFTQNYLQLITENGTKPCHDLSTASAQLFGLDQSKNTVINTLSCGPKHELTLVSFDENGRRRCHGGDYYEVVLIGPNWRARAPITDLGDGSYSILLQVHPKFAGVYNLKAILTFSNYHGLHRRPERWFRNETVIDIPIMFSNAESEDDNNPASTLPRLKQCEVDDFALDTWAGRWARTKYKRTCPIDRFGRFRCMAADERCDEPWCKGPIGSLESNGWVYSAHCSFRIFTSENAWKCLDKKWLFFWGDSNHVDTVRNFLNFVLGFENITAVPRRFDSTYFNPHNPSQHVRITSMFNGHSNVSLNHEGLFSLHNDAYRNQLAEFFADPDISPDVIIMNSGLHDGMYWKHLHHFVEQGVNEAVMFWEGLINGLRNKPRVIYRNTIATAGWARGAAFNPQKMDVFNKMFVERLRAANLIWGLVDGFDLTYAWHLDHQCSDGVHYGKPPAKVNWYGEIGHQYFVDLMLAHILMHSICIK